MACVGRFVEKQRQNENVKRGVNPDRGSISGYAEIHQAGIFYDKALQPTAQEVFPRAPFRDNFRLRSTGCPVDQVQMPIFQTGDRASAASRTPPWLA